jgi:hypothetical protein
MVEGYFKKNLGNVKIRLTLALLIRAGYQWKGTLSLCSSLFSLDIK